MNNRPKTILVMNSKGGSGKTTLATNLASYFASKDCKTTIMDYDPQGSSLQWLKIRSPSLPNIHGANAAPSKSGRLRSIAMAVPADTEYLIVDAPAGVEGLLLQEIVRKADNIVIPVAPSAIDIHATADFVKELFLRGRIRSSNVKLGVVANRVRNSMPVYEPLERFLTSLKLPFLSRLSDSDPYINAAEQGLGVYEMDELETMKERRELKPIIDWVANHEQPKTTKQTSDHKVICIEAVRQVINS